MSVMHGPRTNLLVKNFCNYSSIRNIHISPTCLKSLKNYRKFIIPNVKNAHEAGKLPRKVYKFGFYNYPMSRDPLGIRHPGYWFKGRFTYVKEMEPELVVPDLTDFKLKPYVSYRVREVKSEPLTAESLFKQTYSNIIIDAYMAGERIEVSCTKQEAEDARIKHQQTGADLFQTTAKEAEELVP